MALWMSNETHTRPRIGVPWRTAKEEADNNRPKIDNYLRAVEEAGGEWVLLSLETPPAELARQIESLDAFVLPGSPADVDPARYGARRHPKCAEPDPQRERVDWAVLDHTFAAKKPLLAICYGTQLLNVYLGGELIQDIASELQTNIRHARESGEPDRIHTACIEGGRLARLAGAAEVTVNSSHHQAIRATGRGLRVTAHAPDGVVEAVEWTGDGNWALGVQWHPERMTADPLAQALFRELVAAARRCRISRGGRGRFREGG